jgi:hypothetical protein
MADIAAANITFIGRYTAGNLFLEIYKVKGDGSGVTIPIRLGRPMASAVGNIDETAGYNPQVALTARVVTYGTAPTINKYHYLHIWGTD